jgi:hypothetical protein
MAFREKGSAAMANRVDSFDSIYASPFLEAELAAVMRREKVEFDASMLDVFNWVIPDRPLTVEIERVLASGYVRGADCWHLATALYLSPVPAELTLLTLDVAQRRVAKALGFAI